MKNKPTSEVNVGGCLRQLRAERGLSIRSRAEQSGLNVNPLSMIENSKISPGVSTLQQIAAALQSPIMAFFETEKPPPKIVYQKAGARQSAEFAYGTLTNLGTGFTCPGLEPFMVTLQPQADSGDTPIVHAGAGVSASLPDASGWKLMYIPMKIPAPGLCQADNLLPEGIK